MECLVSLLDAVRIHHTVTPLDAGFEPPGLPAIAGLQLRHVREPPVAELRHDHRLTPPPADLGRGLPSNRVPWIPDVLPPRLDVLVDMGKGPRRPAGKRLNPVTPFPVMVRHGVVVVEVLDVRDHVEIREA